MVQIKENLEAQKEQRSKYQEVKEKKEQEKKYGNNFDKEQQPKLDNYLKKLGDRLISEKEKEQISSKLKAIFIIEKSNGNDFNLKKSLKKVINTSSFENIGKPSDFSNINDFNEKVSKFRKRLIEQIFSEGKNIEAKEKDIYIPEDSVYYPILKVLEKNGNIGGKSLEKISQKLNETNDRQEREKIFLTFVNNLTDKNLKKSILKSFLNKKEINEENVEKSDFFVDCKDLNLKIENPPGNLEIDLAKNYISIPNPEGKTNKHENISLAMNITLNYIIVKNSIDFKEQNAELIDNIRTEQNLETKYNLLKKIHKSDLKKDAKYGKKSKESFEETGKKTKKEIITKITEKIEQIKNPELKKLLMIKPPIELIDIANLSEGDKKLLKEIEVLKNELEKSSPGEIFEAGEIDKTSEKAPEKKEQN